MTFRFSLQPVLRFRQSVEHQQEILLQQANFGVAAIEREIADVDLCIRSIAAARAHELDSGSTVAEINFDGLRRSVLLERRRELDRELARRQELQRQRSEQFQHARRERELMGTLRRQRLEFYRLQEARREQRQLDDLFLLRREFLRRG